jgi:GxxExxY protein
MKNDELMGIIVDAAFKVHKELGPGLLESIYEQALCIVLRKKGLLCECQKGISVNFLENNLRVGLRVDILVENRVVIEIKSVEKLAPIHAMQLYSYMRAGDFKLGLLVNFNSYLLKDGLRRISNSKEP